MNKCFLFAAVLSVAVTAGTAKAASQVEVNLYGQVLPGVHGHVRVADPYPSYDRIVVIEAPYAHQRDWGRYCHHYRACGQSVRFVEVREYQEQRHWHKPKRHKHRHRHHHDCDH
ncbi:hypothetical protein [Rheinheimera texasensis]|jgi:hypothetical protein|uniref:hypothetical protein n=1 Tax=Rheinheimera texasensis TaxID=306205 RepID=UPI0004E18E4F|nr:hypothetical protein [Rheinheimera texasensis]